MVLHRPVELAELIGTYRRRAQSETECKVIHVASRTTNSAHNSDSPEDRSCGPSGKRRTMESPSLWTKYHPAETPLVFRPVQPRLNHACVGTDECRQRFNRLVSTDCVRYNSLINISMARFI